MNTSITNTELIPSMDLVALQIFKAVAEAGGITKAAARLHRVQSNITTRVKQLEAQLGTALFYRHKRRLALSPEGRTLLAYAERLLAGFPAAPPARPAPSCALARGPRAARLRRAAARALLRGAGRAAERHATRRAAHRLAGEH